MRTSAPTKGEAQGAGSWRSGRSDEDCQPARNGVWSGRSLILRGRTRVCMGSAWPSRVVLEPSPCSVGWRGLAVWGSSAGRSRRGSSGRWLLCFPVRAPESRYVGFGNTVPPPKKEDDFLNSAMSSLYSVSSAPCVSVPGGGGGGGAAASQS